MIGLLARRREAEAKTVRPSQRVSAFHFESLCLHGLALIVGGELKHLSLRCLAAECLSLKSTFFSARGIARQRE